MDKSNRVSYFSNVASFLSLLAPGQTITSSVPGGGYQAFSGTSMAAPHVAGAWALLREAAPDASVGAILGALRQTGRPITDTRAGGTVTAPRVSLFEALTTLATVENPAPVATALSPAGTAAGTASFALTLTGSGFNAFSVAKWNGDDRPTTVVNTRTIRASIPAADVLNPGTAELTVVTPTPGGGTSSPLTFTIGPPATLTVDASSVAPGGTATVTLANGFGGARDWIALSAVGAPDTSVLQQTNVGAGITSRTWTVTMPTTAGAYEFRLLLDGGYSRVATSPPIVVDANMSPPPLATSLSPGQAIAGSSGFTLSVIGSGFTSSSFVLWNGTGRSTTFVSSMELRAAITASDIATAGAAHVAVQTPPPGGGTSAALTFTIKAPPSLSVSATTVNAGAPVTVTLADGLGGTNDWLALAPVGSADSNVLQWTYVGAGAATRTWTVTMPTTAGAYEFRLFLNAGYTRAATSPAVTVSPATLAVSITTVAPNGSVTATLSGGAGGPSDWLVLAAVGAPDSSALQWTYVGAGVTSRTWTITMPATAGPYEFRLFLNGTYARAATSPPVTVSAAAPTLTVNTTSVGAGGSATVTLTGGPGGSTDRLVLAPVGAPDSTVLQWTYVGAGVTSRTWTVTMPATPGSYEFRLLLNGGPTRAATSPPVSVFAAALAVNTTSVAPGESATVTLTNGPGGSTDWLVLAAVGAPDSSVLQWTSVGAGVTSRAWTVTMPAAPGNYEFRLLLNGGYTRAATSAPVHGGWDAGDAHRQHRDGRRRGIGDRDPCGRTWRIGRLAGARARRRAEFECPAVDLRRRRREDAHLDRDDAGGHGTVRIPSVPERRLHARGDEPRRDRRARHARRQCDGRFTGERGDRDAHRRQRRVVGLAGARPGRSREFNRSSVDLRRRRRDDPYLDRDDAGHGGPVPVPSVPERRLHACGHEPGRDSRPLTLSPPPPGRWCSLKRFAQCRSGRLRAGERPPEGGRYGCQEESAVLRALSAVAIGLAFCGNASAQDASTVIANAQKAMGGVTSITYSGSAKDVAFQQCGANADRHELPGHPRSDAADQQLRPRDRPDGACVASHGRDQQHRARRLDDADAWNVLPAGHASAGGCLATVGRLPGAVHHALGVPQGRGREQRGGEPPQGRRQELHRADVESGGQGAVRQERTSSTAT